MPGRSTTRRLPITKRSVIPAGPACIRTRACRAMNRLWTKLGSRKKPYKGKLSKSEKRHNRALARLRVRVEHALAGVKRARIVKEVLRNTKAQCSDLAMAVACGLHNLRAQVRQRRLQL